MLERAMIVILAIFIAACSPVFPDGNKSILADCFINFDLSAWDDLDGDGVWDPYEPPLEGVEFHIDGRFGSVLSEYPGISDEEGQYLMRTWAPGECTTGDYTITAFLPQPYEPTTRNPIILSLTSADFSAEAQFGFYAPK